MADGELSPIGFVEFIYRPRTLTMDEIAAIRSNPAMNKWVRIVIACKTCDDKIVPLTGVARPGRASDSGDTIAATWYEDLPDLFVCGCGNLRVPLRYLRESMPVLLKDISVRADGVLSMRTAVTVGETEA